MPAVVPRRVLARMPYVGAELLFLASAMGSVFLVACSSGEGEGTEQAPVDNVPEFSGAGDCASLKSVPTFSEAQVGIFSHCVVCHSSSLSGAARHDALATVNFDTYDAAVSALQLALPAVKGRTMPPPRGEGITNTDRNQLYEWALCGTPR